MMLCERRGGWLHQLRPDIIPQGFLTDEEISLWAAFYARRQADDKRRG